MKMNEEEKQEYMSCSQLWSEEVGVLVAKGLVIWN